jgi:hypothetical protein
MNPEAIGKLRRDSETHAPGNSSHPRFSFYTESNSGAEDASGIKTGSAPLGGAGGQQQREVPCGEKSRLGYRGYL